MVSKDCSDRGHSPNLIINGVHKAGTTSIYKYLGEHPDVYASLKKELHYFTPLIYGKKIPPLHQYLKNFQKAGDSKIRLEASPSYFYGKQKIINSIEKALGDVRFILVLRDPAKRFLSFYKQMIKSMKIDEKESLDDFLIKSIQASHNGGLKTKEPYKRSIQEGLYLQYIEPWLSLGSDRLKIVFFDELKNNSYQVMIEICAWLDIDSEIYDNFQFSIENKSLQPKNFFLHNIVYDFYMKNETFFRKNKKIKLFLKSIYNSINHKPFSNKPTENVLETLAEIYSSPNIKLGKLLKRHGYNDLPSWLL